MRIVIQRVTRAAVTVGGEIIGAIERGLMVLVGVREGDMEEDVKWLAAKTVGMRIFDDEAGVMNLALPQTDGRILAVSQFTLNASTRRGNRPSYIHAAGHDLAIPLYELYCTECERLLGRPVSKGIFGAEMHIDMDCDGPVTIIVDSRLRE